MNAVGCTHAACGFGALLAGAIILLRPKGTLAHARLGWTYVACMTAVNATAFSIYRLTDHFNLFHALALISMGTVTIGLYQVVPRCRTRAGLWRHYQYMCWSYVGLLAATNNEAFVRIRALRRLAAGKTEALPLLTTAVLVAVCAMIIMGRQGAVLTRYEAGKQSGVPDAPN